MFVYTMSKKRAFRTALIILAVFVGIAIGIASILTAINTSAAESKLPVYSVERGDNKISLTFDCAWGNSNTEELLAILSEAEIKVTFFVTGEFCDKYPDDVRKFYDAGHEIANHSDKHPRIKGININDFINDTKECNRKIKMITGEAPLLYRGPYGEYDDNTVTTISGMGMSFIQWSVDSIDWKEPDAATISKRIMSGTQSGSILLFHNDLANTTEALPDIIVNLKQQGFEFARVSDLIYTENFKIDNSGKQTQIMKTTVSDSINTHTYSNNLLVNNALDVLSSKLTYEELAAMKNGITPQMTAKIAPLLSSEQIEAVSKLSEDEYTQAWNNLMAVIAPEEGNIGESAAIDENEDNLDNNSGNDEVAEGEYVADNSGEVQDPDIDNELDTPDSPPEDEIEPYNDEIEPYEDEIYEGELFADEAYDGTDYEDTAPDAAEEIEPIGNNKGSAEGIFQK